MEIKELELVKELMPLFYNINESYSFLNISKSDFEKIVLSAVSEMTDKKYKSMVKQIKNYLDNITRESLSNNEKAISIINRFISDCFADPKTEN